MYRRVAQNTHSLAMGRRNFTCFAQKVLFVLRPTVTMSIDLVRSLGGRGGGYSPVFGTPRPRSGGAERWQGNDGMACNVPSDAQSAVRKKGYSLEQTGLF